MTLGPAIAIFGYGSLLFSPERSEAVTRRRVARLAGFRRSFNKLSLIRGCEADETYSIDVPNASRFRRGSRNASLVLGTVPEEGAELVGGIVEYEPSDREQALRETDEREGVFGKSTDGYRRVQATVATADGDDVEAVVYLSNESSPLALDRGTPLDTIARVLIAATPRTRNRDRESGLEYLEGVRDALLEVGIVDRDLEALASAVRAIPGAWIERVRSPR